MFKKHCQGGYNIWVLESQLDNVYCLGSFMDDTAPFSSPDRLQLLIICLIYSSHHGGDGRRSVFHALVHLNNSPFIPSIL